MVDSNIQRCLIRIATRGSIGQKEAFDLLSEVAEAAERQRLSGSQEPVIDAAWNLAREMQSKAETKKAQVMDNARIQQDRTNEGLATGTLKGAMDNLRGTVYWLAGQENKENAQTLARGLTNKYISRLFANLQKDGFVDIAKSRDNFEAIAREFEDLRPKIDPVTKERSALKPIQSGDNEIRRIAKLMIQEMEAQRIELNDKGSPVEDFTMRTHDAKLIRRGGRGTEPLLDPNASFERWWSVVNSRLDERTFVDLAIDADRKAFGREVFNDYVTGGQARPLYWKDGQAFADYNKLYGRYQNWLEMMVDTSRINGQRRGVMTYWGNNPSANLDAVLRNVAEEFRNQDPDGVARFIKGKSGFLGEDIRTAVKMLDGTMEGPGNEMAAKIGATSRAAANTVLLGGVGLTHFSSLFATVTSDALMQGDNVVGSLGRMISSQFKSLSRADQVELLSELGAYGDGLSRHLQEHMPYGVAFDRDTGYMIPAGVAKTQDAFMTATGIHWVFEHTKAGRKAVLSDKFGERLGGDFDKLKPQEQTILQSYNIGPEEWKILQSGTPTKDYRGRNHLTPDIVETANRDLVENLLRQRNVIDAKADAAAINRAVNSFTSDLSDRLVMFFQDSADLSTVTAGVRQRAMLQSATPGTVLGELQRSLVQFHSWPVAAMHQIFARHFYESAGATKIVNLGIIAGMSMLGGYIRRTIDDLANGLPPREPRTVGEASKLALYWMAAGGGSGIIGDWLFAELNRTPNALEKGGAALGGPVLGAVGGLAHILLELGQSVGTDDEKQAHTARNAWNDIVRSTASHIPFANLLYTKGAVNYLVNWHLFHAMKPEWWQHSNETIKKEQGRVHFGYRPYSAPPYHPF